MRASSRRTQVSSRRSRLSITQKESLIPAVRKSLLSHSVHFARKNSIVLTPVSLLVLAYDLWLQGVHDKLVTNLVLEDRVSPAVNATYSRPLYS